MSNKDASNLLDEMMQKLKANKEFGEAENAKLNLFRRATLIDALVVSKAGGAAELAETEGRMRNSDFSRDVEILFKDAGFGTQTAKALAGRELHALQVARSEVLGKTLGV